MTSLIPQYRQMMAAGHFKGLSVVKFADEIGGIIAANGIHTVLDYGSGQGHQYMPPHSLDKKWDVDVTMYDPAIPGLEELPGGKFDMVLCSDVLEHVPIDDVGLVAQAIFARAGKVVFATVCCRPAKKSLPDGQNVHVTIRPMEWWQDLLAGYATVPFVLRETP